MTTTPVYAIGYARVSTPKQAVEGESLDIQAEAIARFIENRGWRVFPNDQVIQEPFTGTTNDRPRYRDALRLIKHNPGRVRYFVVKTIDRFSREGAFGYKQMKRELATLGVDLRDIGGVIQPAVNSLEHLGFKYSWSERSPSDLGEVVIAEAADQERHRLLTRLTETQIRLTQDGYHLGPANDGYVSKRIVVGGKRKVAQFPDPGRAEFYRTMFAMRAAGAYSDEEIVQRLNAQGFRSKAHNRWNRARTTIVGPTEPVPLTVKQLQRIIKRPAYCGVVVRKWTHGRAVRAQGGQPLVSIDLYNRANRSKVWIDERNDGSLQMRYGKETIRPLIKRNRFSKRWPYKNVVRCPRCERPLWASASRGKSGRHYAAYHCNRKHERYSVAQPALDSAYSGYLKAVRFEKSFLEAFEPLVACAFQAELERSARDRESRNATILDLEQRRRQLALAFAEATSPAIRQVIDEQVQQLDRKIEDMRAPESSRDIETSDVNDFIGHAKIVLEHPSRILENVANLREQLSLFGLFFESWPTYEEIVSGTPKLRPILSLFCEAKPTSSPPADRLLLNWNTLQEEIARWQQAYWAIDTVSERMKIASESETDLGHAAAA
jgi:site-specific DNA recombinase